MLKQEQFINAFIKQVSNKRGVIYDLYFKLNESNPEETIKLAQSGLIENSCLTDEERELLQYISTSYQYAVSSLNKLFKDKKSYDRFIYYYLKHPFFTKKKKDVLSKIFLYFPYSFSVQEIDIFKNIFEDENHCKQIIKEVIQIAIEKEEKEMARISKYQNEIPIAKSNVKTIENALLKSKNKYESSYKNYKKYISKSQFCIIYQENLNINHAILQFLSEKSIKVKKLSLKNVISDNENENYVAIISLTEHTETAAFLYEIFPLEEIYLLGLPLSIIISNCELNNVPLIGQWPLEHSNVYAEFRKLSLISVLGNYGNLQNSKSDMYDSDTCKVVINELKNQFNLKSDLDLAVYLYYTFQEPLALFFEKRHQYLVNSKSYIKKSLSEVRNTRKYYLDKAIEAGYYKTKWKSELQLFNTVKQLFPSAIFQYRSTWLEKQSLDIYIPDLKIGIEYQGKQHYEPIEFFGGEIAFENRKYLDQMKREKCIENDITLIEWKYDDIISKNALERRIKDI